MQLPPECNALINLTELSLNNNQLSTIPPEFNALNLRIFKSSAGGREQVLAIEGPGSSVAELPCF